MLTFILGGIAAGSGLAGPDLVGSALASPRAPDAARQLIHDPRSGLALHGFDPVAFHTESRALLGRDRFEAGSLGYMWRFISAANREAFLATPTAYLPLFGGHDAVGVAEGRMVEGDPTIFLIAGDTTVFFRDTANREVFARDPEVRRKAMANWRDVALQFAGH